MAVGRYEGSVQSGLLLLCDHASNYIPEEFGNLGLPEQQLQRHIAYDIGVAEVTRAIARELQAPALFGEFSRLLIDANRGYDDPTLVMRLSDGAMVPGNRYIDATGRKARMARFWQPYHDAIEAGIARFLSAGITPIILSLHSFTPVWKTFVRPWQVGILWDQDPRLPKLLIEGFAAQGDLTVGDNQPYDGALKNDTLYFHATRRGLAHGLIEYRQDLIGGSKGQAEWVERTLKVLRPLLGRPELHERQYWGSRTGPVDERRD